MKVEITLSQATRLINPGPVVLVTARHKDAINVMAAAWTTPISHEPPLVGVSISPRRFTHDLIEKSGEFVLNVPGRNLLERVEFCGSMSGRDVDKFKEAHLTPVEAKEVCAPLIKECLGHLECAVVEAIDLGDHTLFVGQVVAAWAEEGTFNGTWLLKDEEAKPLHHLGGTYFGILEERLEA